MVDLGALFAILSKERVEFVVVGGVAAAIHGSARVTQDLDFVYSRASDNIRRLARALAPLHPYPRGAPAGLPFRWDEQTLANGLNFTLATDLGSVDLLGELSAGETYDSVLKHTLEVTAFGSRIRCLDLPTLIRVKRAVGRRKDLEAVAELEAIRDERERDST